MTRFLVTSLLVVSGLYALDPQSIAAQAVPTSEPVSTESAITISFVETPIPRVLQAFSEFSGRSIVVGRGVEGAVTASIREQPWDSALQAILDAQGMSLTEGSGGILIVTDGAAAFRVTEAEALATRVYRLRWQRAADLQDVVASMLSKRGTLAVAEATNSIVVTDSPSALRRIAAALGH